MNANLGSTGQCTPRRDLRASGGFTLLEVLAALIVMGVATSIFISLYAASMSLNDLSRQQRIAATLAEESLADLRNNPSAYDWPPFQDAEVGARMPLRAIEKATPPSALPTSDHAYDREQDFYYDFTVEPFAVVPASGDPYTQVTVLVRWLHNGRERSLALSSILTQTSPEEGAS